MLTCPASIAVCGGERGTVSTRLRNSSFGFTYPCACVIAPSAVRKSSFAGSPAAMRDRKGGGGPGLYGVAASVMVGVENGQGALKTLVYGSRFQASLYKNGMNQRTQMNAAERLCSPAATSNFMFGLLAAFAKYKTHFETCRHLFQVKDQLCCIFFHPASSGGEAAHQGAAACCIMNCIPGLNNHCFSSLSGG